MIKIENKQVYSTDGKSIHRIGSEVYFKRGTTLPADTPADFEEVDEVPPYTKAEYDAKVAELVRERYSVNEEFAIQRKMLNALLHPEAATIDENGANTVPIVVREFEDYNSYVDECKARANDVALYSEIHNPYGNDD